MSSSKVPWPLGSRPIHITHVESPAEIWIRDDRLQDVWKKEEQRFNEILQETMKTPLTRSSIDVIGKLVAIKMNTAYYRGHVISMENDVLTCRLVDFGKIVKNISKDDVRILPKELNNRIFCICAALANIVRILAELF